MMSGHDVDGTDQATLGSFVGKANGGVRFYMPRKHFAEHGAVWIMALVRPEHIHQNEAHPLTKVAETYLNTVADPAQWETREPVAVNPFDWTSLTVTPSISNQFYAPFGNQYRMHNNRIHPDMAATSGYPWSNVVDTTLTGHVYHSDNDYAACFTSVQFGHWQMAVEINCDAWRRIPKPEASIFTGSH